MDFALRPVAVVPKGSKAIILSSKGAGDLPEEGYKIVVRAEQIEITGKGAGLFYGVQTLMQLIPEKTGQELIIPAARIEDYPRFKYRGMMLAN